MSLLARCIPWIAALVVTLLPPSPASAARAETDSLAIVRHAFAAGRAVDAEVRALAQRIVDRRRPERSRAPGPLADALDWLGRAYLARVETAIADSLLREAVELRRATRPPDPVGLARSLAWFGEVQRTSRRLASADSALTEALAWLDRAPVRDVSIEARIRVTRGNILAERGRGPDACAELERAVALAESTAPVDSLLWANALRNLGRAQNVSARYEEARTTYGRARAVQSRHLGPDHPEIATTEFFMAMNANTLGDYLAQRTHAERAVAIRERVFGPNHSGVAVAVAEVGSAYGNLGDFEMGLPHYERALAILRALPNPAPLELSSAANNLGMALTRVGQPRRGRQLLEEARAIRERAFGPGAGRGMWSRVQMAHALLGSGELGPARAEADSAIALGSRSRRHDDVVDLAEAFEIRGLLARLDADPGFALACLDRGVTLRDSVLGASAPPSLALRAQRGVARLEFGRRAGAWDDASRVEAGGREILRQAALALSEREALLFERHRLSGLGLMLALACDSAGVDAPARTTLADAVVRSRLLVLDQLAEERRAIPANAPDLADAIRELEQSRLELAAVMLRKLRTEQPADSTVTRARLRRESAERALAARATGFDRSLQRTTAGFADVRAALPPGSVMVSFVRFGWTPQERAEADSARIPHLGERRYAALVTRASAPAPAVVPLGSAARVEAAIARWLEACATPPPADPALARAAERRCAALGQAVRALTWTPLERWTRGAERVFIVPDGMLHAVNFQALPEAGGGYVAERGPTLHRLTAERDLLDSDDGDRRGHGLLAMGGADFDRAQPNGLIAAMDAPAQVRASAPSRPHLRFPVLPHTGLEAEEIAQLWRTSSVLDAMTAFLHRGSDASEASFRQRAPGRRVLHLATHGFTFGDSGAAQPLGGLRAVGAVVSASTRSRARLRASPLPGLAFAGANAPLPDPADDGFLTAEEITSLDLTGVEWAVLSACETGLSDAQAPEAVQGLQRAFRRAGVRTVIMSLWAVDDEATRSWMRKLYAARLSGQLDTSEAVRAATVEMLRERRRLGLDTHPFHWAPMVAAGDWR